MKGTLNSIFFVIILILFAVLIGCGSDPRTSPPHAPTGLTAKKGANFVDLQWNAAEGVTSYKIYRSKVSGGPYRIITEISTTAYRVTDLDRNIVHYIVITAINSSGESEASNEVGIKQKILIMSPYKKKKTLYKGQTHDHSTNSDGSASPDQVVASYESTGYDFLVITDHDCLTAVSSSRDILLINGIEEYPVEGHVVAINPTVQQVSQNAQEVINSIVNEGGLAILAHANYSIGFSVDELNSLNNYSAMEIHNNFVESTGGHGNAEDKWDHLLSSGKQVFGVASDDSHSSGGVNHAWVMVHADNLTAEEIVDSLKKGNFYASTGPDINVEVNGETITASTGNPARIEFLVSNGRIAGSFDDVMSASYTVLGDEGYVRIRLIRSTDAKKAWSNPIFIH